MTLRARTLQTRTLVWWLIALVELAALAAGPIVFALAYTDSFAGAHGLLLALVSVAVGAAVWALATLLLEGRLRGSALLRLIRRTALTSSGGAPPSIRHRIPRRLWVLLALMVCVAGYTASITPFGATSMHRFAIGSGETEDYVVEQPVPLGGIIAGTPAPVGRAQFAPDGRTLYVTSGRGECEALWSAHATLTQPGELAVDVRIGASACFPGAVSDMGIEFAARITLDSTIDANHPPRVVDADTGDSVLIEPWQE